MWDTIKLEDCNDAVDDDRVEGCYVSWRERGILCVWVCVFAEGRVFAAANSLVWFEKCGGQNSIPWNRHTEKKALSRKQI
jgi:hypothetical protein